MSGCGRQWCSKCGEELIHRDHRHGYESASALGQIIWREGPSQLSVTDADVISRKGLPDGRQLMRVIEQKQPRHTFDGTPQERTFKLLDAVLMHCGLCPDAAELHLDPRSGVFVVKGEISAAAEGRRRTQFGGPQKITRLATGQEWAVETHEQFFRFLDPQDRGRRDRDEDGEAGR
jgi:hypothetical protein